MTALKQKLLQRIADAGPISVADYMQACLYDEEHGYYSTRPAIGGGGGDFLTAPEASQMFGELIGLWCAHEWNVLGNPAPFHWIELGPGTGALMSDAWRATRVDAAFRDAAHVQLVETSTPLRALQAQALAKVGARARWRERLEGVPAAPSLIVANEFLDCLPIQQFVRTSEGWRERRIGAQNGDLAFVLADRLLAVGDPRVPPALHDAPEGAIAEHAPGLSIWVDAVAARLRANPGRVLVIDYAGDGGSDTLQALRAHQKESPLASPGEADLTARVDYTALKILARASGLDVAGPVGQGDFLTALGLYARAQALTAAHTERAARIAREVARLTHDDQMGTLFRVICLSSQNLPPPSGL